jgi:3-methyladenine DNA glycosylase AlkD
VNIAKLIKDYQKFLKENSNVERSRKEKAYLYSDLKHYGVSVWQRRKFVKKRQKVLKSLSKKEAISLVEHLWSRPYFEERAFALNILNLHANKLNIYDMPLIERLMKESKGWAFLDSLIIPIMPHILEKNKKAYKFLEKWIEENDFWVRRSALLAQLLFFRKGNGGNKKLFFQMAKAQFNEDWIGQIYTDKLQIKRAKFFIRKAIGWTLREMSIKDPSAVFKFLKENKSEMSGLSFREGSRKLSQQYQKKLK